MGRCARAHTHTRTHCDTHKTKTRAEGRAQQTHSLAAGPQAQQDSEKTRAREALRLGGSMLSRGAFLWGGGGVGGGLRRPVRLAIRRHGVFVFVYEVKHEPNLARLVASSLERWNRSAVPARSAQPQRETRATRREFQRKKLSRAGACIDAPRRPSPRGPWTARSGARDDDKTRTGASAASASAAGGRPGTPRHPPSPPVQPGAFARRQPARLTRYCVSVRPEILRECPSRDTA